MDAAFQRVVTALSQDYRVEREIGRGGMATVYLAKDLRLGRQVAVKVLDPAFVSTLARERFLREVDLSSKLTHPHIVPIFTAGEADGLLYYTMPFIEGESLRHRLQREGPLPIKEAIEIAREAADALAYAHQHGIVHRDVKPENILLSGGHAVVADFGIARAVRAAGGVQLTQSGIAVGTPAYMSPEQALGSESELRAVRDALGTGALCRPNTTGRHGAPGHLAAPAAARCGPRNPGNGRDRGHARPGEAA
jgi:serine/threonine-protein kinase